MLALPLYIVKWRRVVHLLYSLWVKPKQWAKRWHRLIILCIHLTVSDPFILHMVTWAFNYISLMHVSYLSLLLFLQLFADAVCLCSPDVTIIFQTVSMLTYCFFVFRLGLFGLFWGSASWLTLLLIGSFMADRCRLLATSQIWPISESLWGVCNCNLVTSDPSLNVFTLCCLLQCRSKSSDILRPCDSLKCWSRKQQNRVNICREVQRRTGCVSIWLAESERASERERET